MSYINLATGLPFAPSWPKIRSNHAEPYITLSEGKVDALAASPQTFGRSRGLVLGARGIACGGKAGYTSESYIMDGLVHQFDAIDNVGRGQHDNSATVWANLAGTGNLTLYNAAFTDDSVVTTNGRLYASSWLVPSLTGTWDCTLEYVMTPKAASAFYSTFSYGNTYFYLGLYFNYTSKVFQFGDRLWNGCGVWDTSTVGNRTSFAVVKPVKLSTVTDVRPPLYCNGQLAENSDTYTGGNSTAGYTTVGGGYDKGYGSWTTHAVRYYNRQLTADEIKHNYEVDKARYGIP